MGRSGPAGGSAAFQGTMLITFGSSRLPVIAVESSSRRSSARSFDFAAGGASVALTAGTAASTTSSASRHLQIMA